MKTLIALSGRSNIGKSYTIKAVYELLKNETPTLVHIVKPAETTKEIRAVVIISGKRIGIESRGDTREIVENALNIFKKEKCDIILCATRTRGGSWDAVKEFSSSNKFKIDRINKTSEESESVQISSNKKLAKKIASEINLFIKS